MGYWKPVRSWTGVKVGVGVTSGVGVTVGAGQGVDVGDGVGEAAGTTPLPEEQPARATAVAAARRKGRRKISLTVVKS
jgi:hypothetical protein